MPGIISYQEEREKIQFLSALLVHYVYQNETNKSEPLNSCIINIYCTVIVLSLHELFNVMFKVCRNNKRIFTLSSGSVSDKGMQI